MIKSQITHFYKKCVIALFLAFLFSSFSFAQDITLQSQEDVDNFDPSIESISGDLTILITTPTDSITNLDKLSALLTIEGSLFIGIIQYSEEIDYFNFSLLNLEGLDKLTSIGENLDVINCDGLQNIDALSSLTAIGGDINIRANASLQHIDGLMNFTAFDGDLILTTNESLQNLNGLANLTTIDGDCRILLNDVLYNLDDLTSLVSVGGTLFIDGPSFQQIDGLSNLTTVGGDLELFYMLGLQDVDGLLGVTSIGGKLQIATGSFYLSTLDGLSNLVSVEGDFNILDNYNLVDCCGIQDILSTPGAIGGDVNISGNQFECRSEQEVLDASCGSVAINDTYLNYFRSIAQPNPSEDIFNIKIPLFQTFTINLRCQITNALGAIVYDESFRNNMYPSYQIDLSNESGGIYFYYFLDNNNHIVSSGKLIKE